MLMQSPGGQSKSFVKQAWAMLAQLLSPPSVWNQPILGTECEDQVADAARDALRRKEFSRYVRMCLDEPDPNLRSEIVRDWRERTRNSTRPGDPNRNATSTFNR